MNNDVKNVKIPKFVTLLNRDLSNFEFMLEFDNFNIGQHISRLDRANLPRLNMNSVLIYWNATHLEFVLSNLMMYL